MNVFITGATDGIGRLTAEEFAKRGFGVYIHGRNPQKVETAVYDLQNTTGNANVFGYKADFANFAEVRMMVEELMADNVAIDILINNAGMAGSEKRRESSNGLEICFQVNYLSGFLLTHLLLPILKKSDSARVVNVSSLGQYHIDFNDVFLEKQYDGIRAYRQSKLAQIMSSFDLAQEWKSEGITVVCLHPGSMLNTKIAQEMFGTSRGNPSQGIEPIVYLATTTENISGKFFNAREEAKALPQAYDEESRRKLKALSIEATARL